jgi:hypothetical protein
VLLVFSCNRLDGRHERWLRKSLSELLGRRGRSRLNPLKVQCNGRPGGQPNASGSVTSFLVLADLSNSATPSLPSSEFQIRTCFPLLSHYVSNTAGSKSRRNVDLRLK